MIMQDSVKCLNYFGSQVYDISSEEFKTQLLQLTKMAYISIDHLQEEFKSIAKYTDSVDMAAKKEGSDTNQQFPEVSTSIQQQVPEISNSEEQVPEVFNINKQVPEVFNINQQVPEVFNINQQVPKVFNINQKVPEVTVAHHEVPAVSNAHKQVSELHKDYNAQKEDQFITTILKAIKRIVPKLQYKPRRMRKKFRVIPFEFASIWRNLPSIFTEVETLSAVQECALPKVSWERVNRGALKKIPTPSKYKIHSVSPLASFYAKNCGCSQYYCGKYSPCSCPTDFEKKNPFGLLPGFMTNVGIVPVPTTPLFGYIWDQDTNDWLLHAEVPSHSERSLGNHHNQQRLTNRRSRAPERRRTRGRPRRR